MGDRSWPNLRRPKGTRRLLRTPAIRSVGLPFDPLPLFGKVRGLPVLTAFLIGSRKLSIKSQNARLFDRPPEPESLDAWISMDPCVGMDRNSPTTCDPIQLSFCHICGDQVGIPSGIGYHLKGFTNHGSTVASKVKGWLPTPFVRMSTPDE